MAKTALNQLQEQIEAVRSEAFAAGYAAAMQAVRDLVSRPSPGTAAQPAAAAPAPHLYLRAAAVFPGRRGRLPARRVPSAAATHG